MNSLRSIYIFYIFIAHAQVVAAEGEMPAKGKSFVDYQDNMVKLLKAITRDAHDMVC